MKGADPKRFRGELRRAAALLLALAAPAMTACSAADGESTRGIMGDVVAALRVALPASLDEDRFSDPANRTAILAALRQLAASGERLEQHGEGTEASFAFLSHSLARDTRDIARRFEAGRTNEARFLLQHTTEVCVACHARLPDAKAHTLGQQLMATEEIAALPADERAQFEMATRQFEAAARSFEDVLADPRYPAADLDLEGIVDTYLELCLRVLDDRSRVKASLRRLLERDDIPAHMRANIAAWIASLAEMRDFAPSDAPVADARRLIANAQDRTRYRDDRHALIPMVTASGVLHRFLESHHERTPQVGEAYYLLGVIEASVGRSFWTSQTEHLLEVAIRIGPGETWAPAALDLLEEFVIAGYTGSAGTNVPPDEQQRLDELRELVEDARAT